MKRSPDYISILLIIAFLCLAISVILFAGGAIVNSVRQESAEASICSRPTWPDITTETPETTIETTAETESSEETEPAGAVDIEFVED